jgi:glycerophosphoryl diester phosphodiesterase
MKFNQGLTAPQQKRCLLVGFLFVCGIFANLSRSAMGVESNIIRSPIIIAHRGGRNWAPENTMAAFKKCIEVGCDGIECDVQRCKTGELVVIHDEMLERTTSGTGPVSEKTYDEIRSLDAGKWYSIAFSRETVPTLKEVLDLADGKLILSLEIKNAPVSYPGIEDDLIAQLDKYQHPDKVVISSFDHDLLHRIHLKAPKYKLALLMVGIPYELGSYAEKVGARAWNPNIAELREDSVKSAHKDGLDVNVWTVNEPKEWKRAADIGVDGIITDDPLGLMEYLKLRTTASAF